MSAIKFLKDMGNPADLAPDTANGSGQEDIFKSNVHVHLPPNFSAFDSVQQVIELAKRQGIKALGASNYYFYEVYEDFARLACSAGIFPLFGLEIIAQINALAVKGIRVNDPGNPGRMYICGKGITKFEEMNERASALIGMIRTNDARRMAEMTTRLGAFFAAHGTAIRITDRHIIKRIEARHKCPADRIILQERHLAQAFQEVFFETVKVHERAAALSRMFGTDYRGPADNAVKVQNDIRSFLMKAGKPAFVEEIFLDYEQSRELILELGGIPCYPTLVDGASKMCEFEDPADSLVREIQSRNITLAEFIPIRNQPEKLEEYVMAYRKAGIAVVAGTEHNTLDLLPLDPACAGGQQVPGNLRRIFHEGTCIVAAHQYLTVHGQTGFVDSLGRPNPDYPDAESRIAAFSRLGAAVIRKFAQAHPA